MNRITGRRHYRWSTATCYPVKRTLGVSLAMAGCLLVAACSLVPSKTPEEIVAQRAMDWAEALMALDYDTALTYMTPAYQNSPRSDRFEGDFSGTAWWQSVTVKSVECVTDDLASRCEVRQIIMFMRPPAVSAPMPIPYDSQWIELGGLWYMYRD